MVKINENTKLLSISEVSSILVFTTRYASQLGRKKDLSLPCGVGLEPIENTDPKILERIANDKSIVKDLGIPATDEEGKMNLTQLKQFLWKSADILRGKIDSSDYKKYIFGLLFYKRISDMLG